MRRLLKTLWEKEKMLVTSIFSFPTMFSTIPKTSFDILFKSFLSSANAFNLDLSKILSFGKGLICLQYKSFENIVGKGEIAHNEQFLLFPQCFLPIWGTFCYLYQIYNYRLQTLSVWKGIKFVNWECSSNWRGKYWY